MLAKGIERNTKELSNMEVSEVIESLQRNESVISVQAADGSFEKIGSGTKVLSSRATPTETEL